MATPRRACAGLLALVLPCFLLHGAAVQPVGEAQLLLQIKRAWGDLPALAAWDDGAGAHCAWPYVRCDPGGRVTELDLASLDARGPIPDAVGGLSSLTHLDVSNNYLVGGFSTALYRCASLRYLNVSQNYLSGELPADIGHGLGKNLTVLDINGNEFNGTIPPSLSSLRSLRYLSMSSNHFAGTIPAELGELTNLRTLYLAGNMFDTGRLPASFKNLTKLTALWVEQCNLVGDFPSYVVGMPELQILDLAGNAFTGSIPAGIWSLKKLKLMSVYMNNLTGDMVVDDFSAMSLTAIDVSDNKLTGIIPEGFGLLENLTVLSLFGNNFSGEIPVSIGRLPSLETLRLYSNRFSGTLPPELGKHSQGLIRVEADDNELTGTIPEGLFDEGQFRSLTASRNRLNGSIPAGLANCTTLSYLELDDNQLSGEVPEPLWTATQLGLVLLQNNRLTGSLPRTMYINLETLHIGNNQFGGSIPAVAVSLKRFNAENNQFSGEIPGNLGNGMPQLLALNLTRRRLAKEDDWKITPFQALDFKDAAIPHGLKEENLVGHGGSGRVYRVTYTNRYNGSTGVVTVKQIQSSGALDKKLEREFESKAGILGNIRHNNIVKLLCCLSGAESKLLVYEYMDNGSLDMWLHGHALRTGHAMVRIRSLGRVPLDWPTRLGVAIGAAQGLCYMHHECSPPIVHRDIKTSNILLDSEFRAKVADFGLARLLVQAGAPETMSVIAGSIGYIAPECAYTRKVNEKMDVYSFGVVLLELTTGKEAGDGGEHGCLAEWARHHYRSGASITDTIDKCIKYAGYHGEIETVFRLGVTCTGNSPSSRPTMKDVLQILLKCSEQTHQKSETGHSPEYEAAPLVLPQ
ncbi:Leucine-rich repeat receptor-like protein kinase PXL2 [Panicum miliaceum]|uniref:Leucine-rich repeat receptor-like protein kinase PXL2 n=1 Tax=Panicum miliaceum TaxID=4540 RepID=A0A3L6SXE4_PANMI|nr:Leucine-rich repeat receptor-like protein kinase PXL2 [Panicum miliaceum]